MVTSEPKVNLTDKYPIGKAAKVLDVSRWTLLSKYKAGMIKAIHSRNGRKYFTGREILRYWKTN